MGSEGPRFLSIALLSNILIKRTPSLLAKILIPLSLVVTANNDPSWFLFSCSIWVVLSSHIRCFWVLNFLGFVLVCSSSIFLSFFFFDTLSLWELFVGVSMVDLKLTFLKVYSVLKSELLEDSAFEWTDDSRQWVELVCFLSISYSYIVSHLLSHHSSSSFCSFIFDKVSIFFHGVDYHFCFIGSCKFRCHSLHVIHIFCLKIRNPKKSINVNDCVLNGKRFGLINIVRRVLENIEMVNGNIHVLRIKICRSDVNFIGFKFSGFVSLLKCFMWSCLIYQFYLGLSRLLAWILMRSCLI